MIPRFEKGEKKEEEKDQQFLCFCLTGEATACVEVEGTCAWLTSSRSAWCSAGRHALVSSTARRHLRCLLQTFADQNECSRARRAGIKELALQVHAQTNHSQREQGRYERTGTASTCTIIHRLTRFQCKQNGHSEGIQFVTGFQRPVHFTVCNWFSTSCPLHSL